MVTPKHDQAARRGSTAVEAALVLPVLMLLILGPVVIGLGVFRNNQIAYLAREGSRWASVHGPRYCIEQNAATPVAQDVLNNAVIPHMSGLNPANMTATLSWNAALSPESVTFTLNYNWVPEAYLSPITFTSTSTQIVTY